MAHFMDICGPLMGSSSMTIRYKSTNQSFFRFEPKKGTHLWKVTYSVIFTLIVTKILTTKNTPTLFRRAMLHLVWDTKQKKMHKLPI